MLFAGGPAGTYSEFMSLQPDRDPLPSCLEGIKIMSSWRPQNPAVFVDPSKTIGIFLPISFLKFFIDDGRPVACGGLWRGPRAKTCDKYNPESDTWEIIGETSQVA